VYGSSVKIQQQAIQHQEHHHYHHQLRYEPYILIQGEFGTAQLIQAHQDDYEQGVLSSPRHIAN
jgi:hypothetical protein